MRTKKKKDGLPAHPPLRGAATKPGGRWRRALLRLGVWCVAILAVTVGLWVGWGALRGVFFTNNPHFTLMKVQVKVTGQMQPAEITARLTRLGVRAGAKNLFMLDLRALRRDLRSYVMVADARLRLRLPDTLVVEVDARVPVAKYQGRSLCLVDSDGWVMPARTDPRLQALPLILGVRNGQQQRIGVQCHDEMVLGALQFLRFIAIRPYGSYFDVDVIQLDYDRAALRVHLHHHGILREHAQLVLPAKPSDMDEALQRVEAILRDRTHAQQPTGFIDATYRVNIPVLP
jgi:hypothetical protein